MLSLYLIKQHATKTYGGLELYFHHSWLLHWMEMSDLLHSPAALHLGKSPQYPFYRRLGGPQSRSLPTVLNNFKGHLPKGRWPTERSLGTTTSRDKLQHTRIPEHRQQCSTDINIVRHWSAGYRGTRCEHRTVCGMGMARICQRICWQTYWHV
jgi:hypothetical protein